MQRALDFGTPCTSPPRNCRDGGGIVNTCEGTVEPSTQPDLPDQTKLGNSKSESIQVFVSSLYITCLKVVRKISVSLSFFFLLFFPPSKPLSWLHFEVDKNPIQALCNSRCQLQRKPKASSGQVHPDAPFICPYRQSVCSAKNKKSTYFRKPLQCMELASTPGLVYK